MGKATEPNPVETVKLRVFRFFRSVAPTVSNLDRALAEEWLGPGELSLFFSQSGADQQHSIRTAKLLLRSGYASRHLIAAALLHDVGKARAHFTPMHRTLIVLLRPFAPRLLKWLGKQGRYRWLAPFTVHNTHALYGAALAQDAGSSDRTVHLIRTHDDLSVPVDEELMMLRWADDHA